MKHTLIALCLLGSISASAQNIFNSEPGYIIAGEGLALPVGKFASKSNTVFGQAGINLFGEYSTTIHYSNFGVIVRVENDDNPGNGIQVASLLPTQHETFFMSGARYTLTIKKFSFDLKALAGVAVIRLSDANSNSSNVSITCKNPAFSYSSGMNIRYSITKKVCAIVSAAFTQTNPRYVVTNGNNTNTGDLNTGNSLPATTLVNISAGLGYHW